MLSDSAIGLVALFTAIGGQYLVLFKIYLMIAGLQMELATCPYHRTGRRPAGVNDDG